VAGYLSWL